MQVLTPRGLALWAFVFRPQKAMKEGDEARYSLTLAWDANANLKKLQKAIEQVATDKWGAKAKKMLASGQLKNPLRDPEAEGNENELLEGKLFLTAKSNEKPGVVDEDTEPLMSQEDFYSGCEARMDIWLYPFDKAGNKGVGAILNNVQKLDDGERLSGRRSAEEAFGKSEDGEDNEEPRKQKGNFVPKKPSKKAATVPDDDDDDDEPEDEDEDEEEAPPPKRRVQPPRGRRG